MNKSPKVINHGLPHRALVVLASEGIKTNYCCHCGRYDHYEAVDYHYYGKFANPDEELHLNSYKLSGGGPPFSWAIEEPQKRVVRDEVAHIFIRLSIGASEYRWTDEEISEALGQ